MLKSNHKNTTITSKSSLISTYKNILKIPTYIVIVPDKNDLGDIQDNYFGENKTVMNMNRNLQGDMDKF